MVLASAFGKLYEAVSPVAARSPLFESVHFLPHGQGPVILIMGGIAMLGFSLLLAVASRRYGHAPSPVAAAAAQSAAYAQPVAARGRAAGAPEYAPYEVVLKSKEPAPREHAAAPAAAHAPLVHTSVLHAGSGDEEAESKPPVEFLPVPPQRRKRTAAPRRRPIRERPAYANLVRPRAPPVETSHTSVLRAPPVPEPLSHTTVLRAQPVPEPLSHTTVLRAQPDGTALLQLLPHAAGRDEWLPALTHAAEAAGCGTPRLYRAEGERHALVLSDCQGCRRSGHKRCERERRTLESALQTVAPEGRVHEVACTANGSRACLFEILPGGPD